MPLENADIMETTVETRRVFDGIILHIDHLTNELSNGTLHKREVARRLEALAPRRQTPPLGEQKPGGGKPAQGERAAEGAAQAEACR